MGKKPPVDTMRAQYVGFEGSYVEAGLKRYSPNKPEEQE
jgi:hypothetical protein